MEGSKMRHATEKILPSGGRLLSYYVLFYSNLDSLLEDDLHLDVPTVELR
jgi:hypothetical protein